MNGDGRLRGRWASEKQTQVAGGWPRSRRAEAERPQTSAPLKAVQTRGSFVSRHSCMFEALLVSLTHLGKHFCVLNVSHLGHCIIGSGVGWALGPGEGQSPGHRLQAGEWRLWGSAAPREGLVLCPGG